MTDIEKAIVDKVLQKIDMELLTDKIAEKVAERIIKKEMQPQTPWITPTPWPIEPSVVMYGCTPTTIQTNITETEDHEQSTKYP